MGTFDLLITFCPIDLIKYSALRLNFLWKISWLVYIVFQFYFVLNWNPLEPYRIHWIIFSPGLGKTESKKDNADPITYSKIVLICIFSFIED